MEVGDRIKPKEGYFTYLSEASCAEQYYDAKVVKEKLTRPLTIGQISDSADLGVMCDLYNERGYYVIMVNLDVLEKHWEKANV